ncbi:uncharacterized protein A4U43_C04F30460 [Asparagus officinalis]|uniref:DUF4378 domain-containing protein n=1 Tax=Asparagus officinalis TaxID=4686 RepID=A0A5P1F5H1_ASPOF|nr:uncharacterized protein A4U43_C04F30460 [Asparagus officinalis]
MWAKLNTLVLGPSLKPDLAHRVGGARVRRFSWKKTQEKEAVVVTVNDIVRLKSFDDETRRERRRTLYFTSSPPPVASSSSSCSEDAEQRSESFASSSSSSNSVDVQTQSQSQNQNLYQNPIQPSEEGANEKLECKGSQSEEEKEQLSPISVMNFPYQEEGDKNEGEEDEASSSGFEQSLANNIKRSKHRLLHKIRRFETLADLLDPLNLDLRFACTEEEADRVHVASPHAITARDLIHRLRSDLHSKPQSDELLFEFFVDELSWSAGTTNENIGRLLPAAVDWINGTGFINMEEHGKSQLDEMERNGRWRCFGFEKDDVAADVEMGILGSLLHELVLELAVTD